MGVKLMSCFGYLPVKKEFKHGSVSVECIDPSLKQGILGPLITAVTTYYTYKELKAATSNFDLECKVDYGELGLLYKAVLSPDEIVAVKRATRESHQSHSDFQIEIKFLSGIHHKHLVNLCGFCEERGEQILVYEFVANGNLAEHFLGESGLSLSWRERVHIAICTAKGLAYLHEECIPPVIHKDVKPSNILLDHNFHAKLANFGPNATHMLTGATGTPGYVDPSYVKSNVGPACDIHSFGVVLLQLVTGKPACDGLRDEASYHLTDWVRLRVESEEFDELLDINLRSATFNPEMLIQMARLGLQCTDLDSNSRPLMSKVVQELEHALHAVDQLHSNPLSVTVSRPCEISYTGSGYTCRSSGSDFSLPELGGKDAHIKFDGMEWIDIKALEVPDEHKMHETAALRMWTLAALSYCQLGVGHPLRALRSAEELLRQPSCARPYVFLGHMYAAEVLCQLERPHEALEHLSTCLNETAAEPTNPGPEDESNLKWKSGDDSEASVDGEDGATYTVGALGDAASVARFTGMNARASLYINLVAVYAMQGNLQEAHRLAQLALSMTPTNPTAMLAAVYVELKLERKESALTLLKQYRHLCVVTSSKGLSQYD